MNKNAHSRQIHGRRRWLRSMTLVALATAGVMAAPASQAASDYPNRPISLVVAYAPGGGVDFVARLIARSLEGIMGQPVVVENRPGGGSVIATSTVVRAQPDGYTLLLADPALVINPSLMKSVPYELDRDLVPLSTVTVSPLVLVVPANSPSRTLSDLMAAGKQSTTGLNYASAGIGTTPHMAGELMKIQSGGNFVHVPYKGSGPAMTDLVAGQVDFAFATQPAAAQFIGQNRLHGLATTGQERSKRLPDLPAMAEQVPGFDVRFWTTLFAPKGTPMAVLEKINGAVGQAMKSTEVLETLEKAGEVPAYMTLADTATFVNNESALWARVVKESGIKQD